MREAAIGIIAFIVFFAIVIQIFRATWGESWDDDFDWEEKDG